MTDLINLFGLRPIENIDRKRLPICLEVRCEECGNFGSANRKIAVAGGHFSIPISLICLDCLTADADG